MEPQPGPGPLGEASAEAGAADVLTGETASEDVDGFDLVPVDGGDVAEVGNTGMVVCEELAGGGVDLGVPGEVAAECGPDCHVEAAASGEE
nr:hypothetical protein [Kutzneria albida]